MKKIDYSNLKNINTLYINQIYTDELQKKWEKLLAHIKLHRPSVTIYPNDVKEILIGNFSLLTNIYNDADNLTEEEVNAAKRIFNYDTSKSKLKSIPSSDTLSRITKNDKYSEIIADFFIQNSSSLGISTCYYCEMTYVFPYKADIYDKKKKKFVEKDKRMFDLDHFFEKADSPITALSLYNFIPSCQVCNSRIKGQKDLDTLYHLKTETNIIHLSDFTKISPSSPDYCFDDEVTIKVETTKHDDSSNIGFIGNPDNNEIIFETNNISCLRDITAFHLVDRYNFPSVKKEALLLEELKQKWKESRIESIAEYFIEQGENITKEMIYKSIFHDIEDKNIIFSKMKRDILLK